MDKKLNIAIVGIGHLGSRHLKVYHELSDKVNIVGICDPQEDRTQKLAEHYQVQYFKNYADVIGKIDAVNICTPTTMHFKVAYEFLKNGIHTFVEKPITTTINEANKLIDIAQKRNCVLQVGHIERFNSAFEGIQHFAKNPRFIECHRLNHFPNRSLDIGVVMDLMIHDIDIILGLTQSKIASVDAVGVKVLTPLEDIANARIRFKNGCVCNLTASRISDEVTRKIRIFLNDAYISLDYVKQEAFVYKKHGGLISKHAIPIEKEEPLKKELLSFIDCVQNKKKPIVSGIEGREALKLALEITKKIWKI
ncbi:MAG: Gfo/Idh/MocA family oxidoreductase [Candidatus Omnitrophica bacterium]|nr:Gfo/Idh/MocA family oxidoreductase [Candidatus Omnitrophota bacterium]